MTHVKSPENPGIPLPAALPPVRIVLAEPRGLCAGVERAIRSVERALERRGPPVFVLNDIVHNTAVVESLRARGAVFVRTLDDVPTGSTVLFSAHGVPPKRWEEARARNLDVIDATCPLVEKVHREARQYTKRGLDILLIGERGHDEVVGTAGWAGDRAQVIFTEEEAETVRVGNPRNIAYLAQTTLGMQDAERVVAVLRRRFPGIQGPPAADICYATQNRQRAVAELAPQADVVLIVGDPQSANSTRLADISKRYAPAAHLISSAEGIDDAWLGEARTVLVSSGASVPEALVQRVVERLCSTRKCIVEERAVVSEDVHFRLPAPLE